MLARKVEAEQPPGQEGAIARAVVGAVARYAELTDALTDPAADPSRVAQTATAASAAVTAVENDLPQSGEGDPIRVIVDIVRAVATAVALLEAPTHADAAADEQAIDRAADRLLAAPQAHASGQLRKWIAQAWQIAALLIRYDVAVQAVAVGAAALLQAAQRRAQMLQAEIDATVCPAPEGLLRFLQDVRAATDPATAEAAWHILAKVAAPISIVGTELLPRPYVPDTAPAVVEVPRAVCVATLHGVPVTDILVVRPHEVYHLGMTIRLLSLPTWAKRCVVEPITTLGRDALSLPRYEFTLAGQPTDDLGIILSGEEPLHCSIEQPILNPALDCPLQVRLIGDDHDETVDVAGLRRLRLRPFDPSRDALTDHEQTDARLLEMYAKLDSAAFDTEDVRAFCRFFTSCVRAAQTIMFQKTFMRGITKITELVV